MPVTFGGNNAPSFGYTSCGARVGSAGAPENIVPALGGTPMPAAARIGARERVVHDQLRLRGHAARGCRDGDDAAAGPRRRRDPFASIVTTPDGMTL